MKNTPISTEKPASGTPVSAWARLSLVWRMTRPAFLLLTVVACVLGTATAAACGCGLDLPLALGAMAQWRKVHIPIFIVFAVLALGHIFSIFLFWGWV